MTMQTNMIHEGDNLEILKSLDDDSIDLIYMDPPFLTGTNFRSDDGNVQFVDKFKDIDDFMDFMRPRIRECHRILKKDGTFYLHCDVRTSAYQRIACDQIFGMKKFLNEIVWKRNRITGFLKHARGFGKITDRILLYGKRVDKDAVSNEISPEEIEKNYPFEDQRGRYQSASLTCDALKKLGAGSVMYEFMGHNRYWQYSEQNMQKLLEEDRIIIPKKPGGLPRRKCYAHEVKVYPTDLWNDINFIEAGSKEKTGYPTQKPMALLERIVKASSNESDIVLDPFCGSGTTCAVAKSLNRNYIGIDANPEAVRIAIERLADIDSQETEDMPPENPFLKKQ